MAKTIYATVYFDKGTSKEKNFGFDSFSENLLSNTMNISTRYYEEDMGNIPDYSQFTDLTFSNLDIINVDGVNVPIFGKYNHISDINVNYRGEDNIYNVSVTLEKES